MGESKEAKRWRFLLAGNVYVSPMLDEDGNVACMLVETEAWATKCYSAQEVNDAVDRAMYMAREGISVYIH